MPILHSTNVFVSTGVKVTGPVLACLLINCFIVHITFAGLVEADNIVVVSIPPHLIPLASGAVSCTADCTKVLAVVLCTL